MEERFIRVPRTARYHVLGDPATARMVWVVLHGFGQLARFFLNKFEGLEEGLLIAAPEGLSRFYLDEQHQRVGATWMTREDREHEIGDQLSYLDALAASLLDECPQAKGSGCWASPKGWPRPADGPHWARRTRSTWCSGVAACPRTWTAA
ncbi:MAG: hypothetical protein R2810_03875 [Flavobacteriales bacterium]